MTPIMTTHDFTVGSPVNQSIRKAVPLTLDDIRRVAPAAFATHPSEKTSNKYTYIPTSEIITGMEKAGFLPFEARQTKARDFTKTPFTKHMIRFRHPDMNVNRVGDVIPELVMINSHDGSSVYDLIAGMFRLACSNGLMIAESFIRSLKVKHLGNILENVVNGSMQLIDESAKTMDKVILWGRVDLYPSEQLAFANSAHTLRFGDSHGNTDTPIKPDALLVPRRPEDTKSDLWTVFNRVQENAVKGGFAARNADNRLVRARAVNGIDQDRKLNQALWQLAEKMAELKAANSIP